MKIILASASPRRKELLFTIVPEFDVLTSGAKEVTALLPWRTVLLNATAKNLDLQTDADIVVSADTGVFLGWKFYGKPRTEEEAFKMLKRLDGRTHSVWTGVTVRYVAGGRQHLISRAVRSRVKLHFGSDDAIKAYIATGSPMDKAGAYGIQDDISSVCKGSLTNVIGLPVEETRALMTRAIAAINADKEAKC